jgi:SAM-dependent methyltransferase
MTMAAIRDWLMEQPWVYAAWQAPFAAAKFAPIERGLREQTIRRVLDVGCGPGTNAKRFSGSEYVGVDINRRYLAMGRGRHPHGRFVEADLTTADLSSLGTFDTILVNSFLHHIPDAEVQRVLAQLAHLLSVDGRVHILEVVLPERRSVARLMARLDRGRHARTFSHWSLLLGAAFEPHVTEPVRVGGRLWFMVYFQGGKRI